MHTLVRIDARSSTAAAPVLEHAQSLDRPSRAEAEQAVRILIRWAGDDPGREGLRDTPARVVRAYEQRYAGYRENVDEHLARTFGEVAGYNELVVLRDIRFVSHCEHHMAPIIGRAHVGYLPRSKVVGISKLARLVEVYAKRLQMQERLTTEIANALDAALAPLGVAVVIEGIHGCMTTRGVCQSAATMITSRMLGVFHDRADMRREFLVAVALHRSAGSGNFSL